MSFMHTCGPSELLEKEKAEPDLPDLENWKARLEQLMREKQLYVNPGLTLPDVAGQLGTSSRQVSRAVNQGFGVNFNDFVNSYRTRALIDRLKADEHHSKTLLALALECGFNSKSTFNRAFKKYTGMTPKSYLEQLA